MKTINVTGTNLFALAAAELGDATQWYRIARLNGLNDPMLYGLATLVIPNYDNSLNTGLPAQ